MLQVNDESHAAELSGSSARGQVRRGAIIGAAAELFRRRGYPDVGIDDIGAVLDLSGPALYRYFTGKPDLLKAVIHGYIEEQNAAWIQQDPDVLTAVVSAAVRNPNGFAVYASQHDYLDEAAWREVAADRARIRHAWDEHMASIGVPRTGADGRLLHSVATSARSSAPTLLIT
jgi:AcrR family transcriptional regulator